MKGFRLSKKLLSSLLVSALAISNLSNLQFVSNVFADEIPAEEQNTGDTTDTPKTDENSGTNGTPEGTVTPKTETTETPVTPEVGNSEGDNDQTPTTNGEKPEEDKDEKPDLDDDSSEPGTSTGDGGDGETTEPHTVSFSISGKGTVKVNGQEISNSGNVSVEDGQSISFTVQPEEGYELNRVKAGNEVLSENPTSGFTVGNIGEDTTVTISLSPVDQEDQENQKSDETSSDEKKNDSDKDNDLKNSNDVKEEANDNRTDKDSQLPNIFNNLTDSNLLDSDDSHEITLKVGETKSIPMPYFALIFDWQIRKSNPKGAISLEKVNVSLGQEGYGSVEITGLKPGKATVVFTSITNKVYQINVENAKATISYEAAVGGYVTSTTEKISDDDTLQGSTAIPYDGCKFDYWKNSKGETVGNAEKFVPNDRSAETYTAVFIDSEEDQIIKFQVNDETAGTLEGATQQNVKAISGIVDSVTAKANAGYRFVNWINSNDEVVSEDQTFTPARVNDINVSETYTANFVNANSIESTAYFYVGVPGASSTDKLDDKWYGMGTGSILTEKPAAQYETNTLLTELLSQSASITYPSSYPELNIDDVTYKYDPSGKNQNTYYITWDKVIVSDGANAGKNGKNPTVPNGTKTFHVDGTLHLVAESYHEVHFMSTFPDSEEFQYVTTQGTIGSVSDYLRIKDGESESSLPQPRMQEFEHYTFDGWYTDSEFTNKADFSGSVTENKTYYGRYSKNEQDVKDLTYTVQYVGENEGETVVLHSENKTVSIWAGTDSYQVKEEDVEKKNFDGYSLKTAPSYPVSVKNGDTVTVLYSKNEQDVKDLTYTVQCYESNSFSIMHRIILLKCKLNYEAFSSVWYNCI